MRGLSESPGARVPVTDHMSQRQTDASFEADGGGFEGIVTGETMVTALEAVGAVASESVVAATEDGLRVAAVDAAVVALVELDLSAPAFEAYRADGVRLGLDLTRLRDVVAMAGRDTPVHVRSDPDRPALHVEAAGLAYTHGLLDPESIRDAPARAELDTDVTADAILDSSALDRVIRAADMVSNTVAIGADVDGMYVEAEGDTDDVALRLGTDDLREFSPGDARSLFAVDYLSAMVSAMPAGTDVHARFGTDTVLALGFDIADGAGEVAYLLSPRLQS